MSAPYSKNLDACLPVWPASSIRVSADAAAIDHAQRRPFLHLRPTGIADIALDNGMISRMTHAISRRQAPIVEPYNRSRFFRRWCADRYAETGKDSFEISHTRLAFAPRQQTGDG
jgi:hypothetical protein